MEDRLPGIDIVRAYSMEQYGVNAIFDDFAGNLGVLDGHLRPTGYSWS